MLSCPCGASRLALIFVTALLALDGPGLTGQSPILKERRNDPRGIVLDVIARPGLQAVTAAAVTDNGKRVSTDKLSLLNPEDPGNPPPQLVLILDAVNSSLQDLARSEDAVQAILKSNAGPLPQLTSVIVLSDTAGHDFAKTSPQETASLHQRRLFVHRIPASQDAAALSNQLDNYKLGLRRILQAQAGAGQAERVQLSLEALSFISEAEASEPGVKLLLWISPGWPFLSRSSAGSSEQVFNSIVYFSSLLRSARIILYSLNPEGLTSQDPSAETEAFMLSSRPGSNQANGHMPNIPLELTPTYYKEFLGGVRNSAESNPNDLALQVLAYKSGGLVLQQSNDLKSQILQCMPDAQSISSLTYEPEADGKSLFHQIAIKRSSDDQPLRTQMGFYTR